MEKHNALDLQNQKRKQQLSNAQDTAINKAFLLQQNISNISSSLNKLNINNVQNLNERKKVMSVLYSINNKYNLGLCLSPKQFRKNKKKLNSLSNEI